MLCVALHRQIIYSHNRNIIYRHDKHISVNDLQKNATSCTCMRITDDELYDTNYTVSFWQVSHHQTHLELGKDVSGTAGIDQTLSSPITFYFYFQHDVPFIELFSPSGIMFDTEGVDAHLDTDVNVLKFRFDFVEVCIDIKSHTLGDRHSNPENICVIYI